MRKLHLEENITLTLTNSQSNVGISIYLLEVCFSVFAIFMLGMVQTSCWFLNWSVGRVFQEWVFQQRMSQLEMSGTFWTQHAKLRSLNMISDDRCLQCDVELPCHNSQLSIFDIWILFSEVRHSVFFWVVKFSVSTIQNDGWNHLLILKRLHSVFLIRLVLQHIKNIILRGWEGVCIWNCCFRIW